MTDQSLRTSADVDAVLARLTLLEKAALLAGKNVWQTRDVPRLGVPSAFLADGPHGVRKQVGSSDHLGLHASEPATCFPTAATVANSWDPVLAERIGRALGAEAAAQGVDVLLGPGLNIKRSPLCGRAFEYFSEDPLLSGRLAAAYVRGIQDQGVVACPKHFAANSQELRRMASDSVVDERTLREVYLTAFEIVVRESAPGAIMSAYNLVNGTYAHENHHLLTEVLREEWGFDGAVVSDWGGANDSVAAVRAGGSLEMPAPGLHVARRLVRAVEDGELDVADLDARVREVLALALRERPLPGPVDADAHHALAREAAARSAVLLKNDGDLLPLAPGTRVAVVGDFAATPRYQGAGSSQVNPTRLDSVLGAVAGSGLVLTSYAPGFRRDGTPAPALVREAVEAAAGADVVLVHLGLAEIAESEGVDRTHLRLADDQVALLRAVAAVHDRVVVVLSAGGVVEVPWLDECTALLHAYLGGQAGAAGVLDVLTGRVAPAGRLAETYPVRLADTPTADTFPAQGRTVEYREGPFVGYRYYTTAGVAVAFPFGFGLTYTTFAYDDLVVGDREVRFTLTNTGARAGAEVAQVYVRRRGDGVLRPERVLAGFARVELAPGERRTVTVALDPTALRHFDTASGSWQVETAEYDVLVGASVTDVRLEGVARVTGTAPARAGAADALPSYRAARVQRVPDAEFAALLGRPVPVPATRGPLGVNDTLGQMDGARSPLARFVHRVLVAVRRRADRRGKPDLNALFVYHMPFRAIAKMTNGVVSDAAVEAILTAVNGRTLVGLGRTVRALVRTALADRRTRRDLATGH
ncbi:glycosyl hydrolase [Cellulomonas sp. JZ18]|uniref:glycoside hydrolase family 3 C-terminal domain-containing protein n=1 Tax=Cellulomonas sp. JZ18 TaxID=2654191 RepID=UPI0012D45EEA|nr:glycoside hydrolase family 3 C-terminal domain-containing protein [Cellulomonas sp. JZ18]QGQ18977.1 glycosyl hydrolase [Cellulomonas sp. JZ18]